MLGVRWPKYDLGQSQSRHMRSVEELEEACLLTFSLVYLIEEERRIAPPAS